MPTQVVDVDLRSETGAIGQQTYSDLVIVGTEPDVVDPDYNVPKVYDSSATVASDFGEGSDVHASSQEVESRGASQWWVVMLDTSTHNEVVGDSDSTTTDEGTVENAPVRGGTANVEITLDGSDQSVIPSTESPPDKPDPGDAAFNYGTGEVVTGESSAGDGSGGIEVTYETASFSEAFTEMRPMGFDLVILADTHADRSYIGELDELATWGDQNDASMVVAYENGAEYEDDEAAMEAAHDIGGYISSGKVLPIAHKATDDVAAGVAGRLVTKQPWFNPYMDGSADYTFNITEQYRRSLIGSPEQPGTFEGGDADGAGPANVLMTEMGVQILSNSLSTAGSASNYQFFDVARTENFIKQEARNAIKSLALSRDSIPFVPKGKSLLENALRKNLNEYVAATGRALSQQEIAQLRQAATEGGDAQQDVQNQLVQEHRTTNSEANVPLSELDIYVPRYDDLTQQDRQNRNWSGIVITARLSGSAHTFSTELVVQV